MTITYGCGPAPDSDRLPLPPRLPRSRIWAGGQGIAIIQPILAASSPRATLVSVTTTLVLAGVHAPVSRYAESLLPGGGTRVLRPVADGAEPALSTTISTVTAPALDQTPQGWSAEESHDLVRSILYSRSAVVVDNLPAWVTGKISAADAWEAPEKAAAAVTDAALELAALLSALPYDAVVISRELSLMVAADSPVDRALQDALGQANTVLSNHLGKATLLLGGRAVDLSAFPALPY